ncbi:hypothetical protein [Clostridium sp. D53t1_180928_C8]|uniref:hypothetical protein n=1 Tax=Clostridium sp. D53t1_180928_C8 TaxID=2787101 RepID=UPI0018AAA561|nr:hypothetical protein [Clostridium sp. D53t1_180928_C8]
MKRLITYGIFSIILIFNLTGCINMKSSKEDVTIRKCTSIVEVSNDNIKMIAYNWLDETNKESIINIEEAKVEEVIREEQYFAEVNEEEIDFKGKIVYKVTFNTVCDEILGPIAIYIDKDNLNVVGMDIRK